MAWVLGEYCYLITVEEDDEGGHLPQERIAEQLCAMARERKFKDPATRGCIVTALLKLSAQSGTVPAIIADFIDHFSKSRDADLQQRCLEFQALVQRGDIMGSCLPMDARLGLIYSSLYNFSLQMCVVIDSPLPPPPDPVDLCADAAVKTLSWMNLSHFSLRYQAKRLKREHHCTWPLST